MEKENEMFISFLFIVIASTYVDAIEDCAGCPNVTLGTTEETIAYSSNETNCSCSWSLPTDVVKSDLYGIAVVQLNAKLKLDNRCVATVAIPGKEHGCKENLMCRIHRSSGSECHRSQVIDTLKERGIYCSNYLAFHHKNRKTIEYYAHSNISDPSFVKSFKVLYYPVNCSYVPHLTTPMTPEETTANDSIQDGNTTAEIYQKTGSDMTTKEEAIEVETTTGVARQPNTTRLQDQTESPESIRARTIGIAVPLTILFVLIIIAVTVVFLWYRKKKEDSRLPSSHGAKTNVDADAGQTQTQKV